MKWTTEEVAKGFAQLATNEELKYSVMDIFEQASYSENKQSTSKGNNTNL
jgi:hypothetical protein